VRISSAAGAKKDSENTGKPAASAT